MSAGAAEFAVTLGEQKPRGHSDHWAEICRPSNCDDFVTIVTPWFRRRDRASAAEPLEVALSSLRRLCDAVGLDDAPWFLDDVGRSPTAQALGWPNTAESRDGAVVVYLLCVVDAVDLSGLIERDHASGACASAILLLDPASWDAPPLGRVASADGAVVRTAIVERRDAFVADCDVSVIRDRQVFRAKFTIPWVERSTLRTLVDGSEYFSEQGDTSILVGPAEARWTLIRRLAAR